MLPVRRILLLSAGALALLLLGAVLAARLVLPGVLQSQAEKLVAQRTGHHLVMEAPQISLFGPRLVLRNLHLSEPDGKPLFGMDALDVSVAFWPLLRGAVRVEHLLVARPQLVLAIRPDGRLNWSPFLQALQAQAAQEPKTAAASEPPPDLVIGRLSMDGGSIDLSDERIAFSTHIAPLDVRLNDLATRGDLRGNYRLAARTSLGAQILLEGSAALAPVQAEGRLAVEGLELGRLAPLLTPLSPLRLDSGTAGLSLRYALAYQPAKTEVRLSDVAALLHDLKLADRSPGGANFAVADLRLEQGQFDLAAGQAKLGRLGVEQLAVSLPTGDGAPFHAGLGSVGAEDLSVDLTHRTVHLSTLGLGKGDLALVRRPDGALDLQQALARLKSSSAPSVPAASPATVGGQPAAPGAIATPAPASAAAAPSGTPWTVALDALTLSDFALRVRDETLKPAAAFEIAPISLKLRDLSTDLTRPVPVEAELRLRDGGRLGAKGQVTPGAPSADLQLALGDLALKVAQPYVSQLARVRLADGRFGVSGRLRYDARTGPRFQGAFGLDALRVLDANSGQLVLGISHFGTPKLEADARRIRIGQLMLSGLDTQLEIEKDKSINMTRLLVKQDSKTGPASGGPAAAAPASVPRGRDTGSRRAGSSAPGKPSAFEASVDQFRISDSALDFADRSLALPFGTRIHDLHGVINGLSTRSDARGQLQLDGQVDEYGLAHAEGQLDLFNPAEFTDIKVLFRNVEMTRLTPYSATFAGRRIDSGKLSLDLDYKVQKRQLAGENQVLMDKLTLGERVDTPGATSLPLDLAIAILEDSDGRIDLGLPVSGSLDDPQFSYGRLVWKAIVNVIGKIVLSPFRALGSLFGGGGEQFESVVYAPGSHLLAPPEREKLQKIATALGKRPGITLMAPAAWSDPDRAALTDLELRRRIAERAGIALTPGADPGPLALRAPDVQAAIEAVAAETLPAAELANLRTTRPAADKSEALDAWFGELLNRVRLAHPVDDAALQGLGLRRAQTVVSALQDAGLPAARITVGEASHVAADGDSIPLKLVPGSAHKPAQ